MNEPDSPASARQTGDTAFSYACHRCRRCCHDKLIQVNPYEIARLARRLGLTTTVFLRDYLADPPHLRRTDDGACVFLGPEGCTVHPDRPLVCRVYPLGRHIQVGGEPRYLRIEPHPQSAGVYGTDGTIDRYLAGQGVADFIAAADQYLSVLQALFDAWRRAPWVVEDQPAAGAEAGAEAGFWATTAQHESRKTGKKAIERVIRSRTPNSDDSPWTLEAGHWGAENGNPAPWHGNRPLRGIR